MMESIFYCMIANDSTNTAIVEVALAEGNLHQVAMRLLPKVHKDNSTSYSYESEYIFHCHNSDGLTLMCMTSQQFSNRKAYALLFDLKDKFLHSYGEEGKRGIGVNGNQFGEVMKERMAFYSSEHADKLAQSRANINRTRDVMIRNLDLVLERGEKIEVLLLKTFEMNESAVTLRKYSTKVKRHMWWKNFKVSLILCLILIVTYK